MKQELEREVLRIVESVARKNAMDTVWGWPPQCALILHQPKRPSHNEKKQ